MTTPALEAMARSNLYGLLAMGFRYPHPESVTAISDGTLARSFRDNLAIVQPDLAEEAAAAIDATVDEGAELAAFEAEYLLHFQTNAPMPSVSLYEGSYAQGAQKPRILLELRGFYTNFGLEIGSADRDLEDCLTAELEFMQFLAAKQAQAHEEGHPPAPYVLAQRDFLVRHLAAWLPRFEEQVTTKVQSVFYRSLAHLARRVVERDVDVVQRLAAATPSR